MCMESDHDRFIFIVIIRDENLFIVGLYHCLYVTSGTASYGKVRYGGRNWKEIL